MRFFSFARTAVVLAVSFFAVTTSVTAQEKTDPHQQAITYAIGIILLNRAEVVRDEMSDLRPADLFTKELARSIAHPYFGGGIRGFTYAARETLFERFQCSIFKEWEDSMLACFGPLEYDQAESAENLEKYFHLPIELADIFGSMRANIYSVGRVHLMNPTNLRETYLAMAPAIKDEFQTLFYTERNAFLESIETIVFAFDYYQTDEGQARLEAIYMAEKDWTYASRTNSDDAGDHYKTLSDLTTELQEDADVAAIQFAHRRMTEGGPEVVAMWETILRDLLHRLDPGNDAAVEMAVDE